MSSSYNLSGGARYTITIQNDRAAVGNFDGEGEFIHTWLVVTDNHGGPQETPRNFAISWGKLGVYHDQK